MRYAVATGPERKRRQICRYLLEGSSHEWLGLFFCMKSPAAYDRRTINFLGVGTEANVGGFVLEVRTVLSGSQLFTFCAFTVSLLELEEQARSQLKLARRR